MNQLPRVAACLCPLVCLVLLAGPAGAKNFLTPRDKSPEGFTRMEWPQKKEVLFGLFAPTDEERAAIDAAVPTGVERSADPPRVLLFYRCRFPHTSIATGVYALEQMAESTGAFSITKSDDPADFSPGKLKEFDAVALLHTTNYDGIIGVSGRAALAGFLADGKGLIGIHAAADASYGWQTGADLVGGVFGGHPWVANGEWGFRLESPEHPLNAGFGDQGFWLKDEVYLYKPGTFSRARSRVLISIDPGQQHNFTSKVIPERLRDLADPAGDYPVAWLHERGGGRVFYTTLGHNASTFREPAVLRHYLDGILYASGRLDADATPSAALDKTEYAGAPRRK